MELRSLYGGWAKSRDLPQADRERIYSWCLRTKSAEVLDDLMRYQRCFTKKQLKEVIDTNDPQMMLVAFKSRNHGKDLLGSYLKDADLETLCGLLHGDSLKDVIDGDLTLLTLLWDRENPRLRVHALRYTRWSTREPAAWGQWLLKSRPLDVMGMPDKNLMQWLARDNHDLMWKLAVRSKDITLAAWVYAANGGERHGPHQGGELQRMVRNVLQNSRASTVKLEAAGEAILCLLREAERKNTLPGTSLSDLTLEMIQRLPQDNGTAARLKLKLYGDEAEAPQEAPPTREELVALAKAGDVHPDALRLTYDSRDPLGDELWMMVATNPKLTPEQAKGLLTNSGGTWSKSPQNDLVLDKRKPTWLRNLFMLQWHSYQKYDDYILNSTSWRLPAKMLEKLLVEILDEERPPLERLLKAHVDRRTVFMSMQISKIPTCDSESYRALLQHTNQVLGDDPATWEIFEALIEEVEDGTYGAFLESALRLSGATKAS